MSGYPNETLSLVFDILHDKLLSECSYLSSPSIFDPSVKAKLHDCMGVFCEQNFEREYIDVLLNKLLLCVIIQIRK